MTEYQVFARKYRPKFFKELVGQEATIQTLVQAIENERLAHAYLFAGPHGTGKTTIARLFAKAINCKNRSKTQEPCNECISCKEIWEGRSLDVLEIDGASHRGIEDIRQLNDSLGYASQSKYKIYIIDEVHMLTKEAFNALLKSLEEPPSHVKFFFATTEPQSIPPTILSRCQRFNLKRIPEEKIVATLHKIAEENNVKAEQSALNLLASLAEGGLRDAESLFDALISFEGTTITEKGAKELFGLPEEEIFLKLDKAASQSDYSQAFHIVSDLFSSGTNLLFFVNSLISHFRAHFVQKKGVYEKEVLLDILELLSLAEHEMKQAPSKKAFLEILLLRIINAPKKISLAKLVARLEELEAKLPSYDNHQRVESTVSETVPKTNPETVLVTTTATTPVTTSEAVFENEKPKAKEAPKINESPISTIEHQPTLNEKSRFDTLTRFAAKEFNGSLR